MLTSARKFLIGARYYLSIPWRRRSVQILSRQGMAPMMIFFYHRVADKFPNDWTLSNRVFRNQIQWIRNRFEIISLADVQDRMRARRNNSPTVSITFDDGYADNCDEALPFLIEHRIPVTYFVTLDNILMGTPFAHDITAGCPLCPNSVEQIQSIANSGIEIGAHSKTHPNLGSISDPETLMEEIVQPKGNLEELTRHPVRYFAFPFGKHENMHSQAVKLVRDAGYAGFCSAYGNYNIPGSDPFHLQRIHGDPEMVRLKNWLSYDPRKLRIVNEPAFCQDNDESPRTIQSVASP